MKRGKKPKKILFLSRLYKPHIGGVETHIEKISHLLVKEKLEVTIICEQHDKKLKTSEKINGINILRLPINLSEKNKKFQIWKWIIKNRNFLKEFDVIHIHDVFFWIIPLIFFLDRKKIFITFHGYESYPIKFSSKIQKKVAAKYCSGSISVGKFINKWYGIASNAVIYGGVDSKFITAKSQNRTKKITHILYIGRLGDDMGANTYINTLKRLKKNGFKFNLEVCGDGKYRKEFEKLGKVNGFVEDIFSYIRKSDIVFSSSYLTMLEAAVAKKAIFSVYSNPLKEDYLKMSPFSKFVSINSNAKELFESISKGSKNVKVEEGYKWAKNQRWENVLKTYKVLWKI